MKKTSWGPVAAWYNDVVEKESSYQRELILPNLLRLINIKKGQLILDIGCGQGFFAREFYKAGAKVIAVDISEELINIAKKRSPSFITYYVSAVESMPFLANSSVDKITIILAIQNIENVNDVFKECNRLLRPKGKIYLVLNHPVFRIPKVSYWGWDEKRKIQYRRIDNYLSESRAKIQMRPGSNPDKFTWSFHRPLQFYSKILSKNNFCIYRIEEWNSHKKSEPGPKAEAENKARKEIPLFMLIEAKHSS